MDEIHNTECLICKCELWLDNVAQWDIPNTTKHNSIRTDSMGRNWCQKCTDEFDSIDLDD